MSEMERCCTNDCSLRLQFSPAGVVDKLPKDIARILAAPDMRDRLAKHGADPMSMTQPEFAHFVVSESEKTARNVEAAGVKPK